MAGTPLAGGTSNHIDPNDTDRPAEDVMFPVASAKKVKKLDARADAGYPGWRDGNAQDLPAESVQIDQLTATQPYVYRDKVEKDKKKFRKRGGFKNNPLVFKDGDKYYIRDGHHRTQAAAEDGSPAIPAHILDLTNVGKVKKNCPTANAVHVETAMGNGDKPKKGKKIEKRGWSLIVPITKVDDSTQTVYGWASVIEKDGKVVTDHQGDQIEVSEMVKAAHDFMMQSRTGGLMHIGTAENDPLKGGDVVESILFTRDVQKALGIDLGKVGWFIGYKVNDPEIYAMCKGDNPTLRAFSIGGQGIRVPV